MPKIDKPILIERFERALASDGWTLIQLTVDAVNSRRYRLVRSGESLDVRLYIWTLTPGGKGRASTEWRIQPTNVGAGFKVSPDVQTLILGYEPSRDVFAGFDVSTHLGLLGASPSIQIAESALDAAAEQGLGPHKKASKEIVFGIGPDLLSTYVRQAAVLHKSGAVAADLSLLVNIAATPDLITPADIDAGASPKRRQVLQTILRTLRDSRFRTKVLNAYGFRCGFCGLQLDLLDAAHVLPVSEPLSTDLVTNGVAMCVLHHRAYDRGLITFDTGFATHHSSDQLGQLAADGRDGGQGAFLSALASKLLGPVSGAHWPDPGLVKAANIHRGWLLS